jgi:tetratricopeptide (TPR) repeat protein
MTAIITETELKKMINKFKDNPRDLDLINQIAIGYLENNSMQTDDEVIKFFELAYSIEKTIKSAHNLAWYLYFEWGEEERAIEIQNECIELKPKSYYPYYLYGYMLQDQRKYKEAIPYLDKAYIIEKHRDILHNVGYCYFQIGEFQKAKDYFSQSTTELDIENRSLYNLALTEWELGNTEEVKLIANKLFQHIKTNVHETVSGYEIGQLYFILNDLERTTDCLVKQGIGGIDLLDWTDLSYSLYRTNNKLWKKQIKKSIEERKKWCNEIETNHEDWSEYTNEEKLERLSEFKSEIKIRQETVEKGMTKPIQDLAKSVLVEYCGCLLFDCKRHENQLNDE